ncbi:hypothetical protein GHT06_022636 [Daphnia sinensis]|uniref:Uncharacterized protein n=1 Tax=Daphnia sinensis TaxID=1820382 RepID=A0AAD5KHD4_9CRUS|nr:hypothetical protein GHT06_022636 [Daphnia sinensis]
MKQLPQFTSSKACKQRGCIISAVLVLGRNAFLPSKEQDSGEKKEGAPELDHLSRAFWSAYLGCTTQYKDAVSKTWEQIDVVHRMADAIPTNLRVRVRYICARVDNSQVDDPDGAAVHDGLTPFGKVP